MKLKYAIKNKPIHIGKFLWRSKSNYCPGGVKHSEYCLTTGESLVYLIIRDDWEIDSSYILFQYKDDEEKTEHGYFVGILSDYQYMELEIQDLDGGIFYDDITTERAIIKEGVGSAATFYYYVSSKLLFGSCDFLYGNFSRNEQFLLNFLFKDKIETLTYDRYVQKKKEIINLLNNLDITNFTESYNIEEHVDSLMYKYVREMIDKEKEYEKQYIIPKVLVWGI